MSLATVSQVSVLRFTFLQVVFKAVLATFSSDDLRFCGISQVHSGRQLLILSIIYIYLYDVYNVLFRHTYGGKRLEPRWRRGQVDVLTVKSAG